MTAPVDERIAFAAVQWSSAAHLLRSAGYETVVVSSGSTTWGCAPRTVSSMSARETSSSNRSS